MITDFMKDVFVTTSNSASDATDNNNNNNINNANNLLRELPTVLQSLVQVWGTPGSNSKLRVVSTNYTINSI